jgi:Pvc16 N-terminal domain
MSGRNVIGETTESLHKFILDGCRMWLAPPRMEEDLKFVPKDREEVIYIYMYRAAQNPNLMNQKRLRLAPVFVKQDPNDENAELYYHRPPVLIDVFYMIAIHSKFRSDAERLLGWLLIRLNEATHLIYRPRRFMLPDGREVDSLGRPYDPLKMEGEVSEENPDDDGLFIEKVSLSLVDDLTVGDAINLFTLHEAPYRPFLTYRARMALDGPLYRSDGGSTVKMERLERRDVTSPSPAGYSANGRVRGSAPAPGRQQPPGPKPYRVRKDESTESEE